MRIDFLLILFVGVLLFWEGSEVMPQPLIEAQHATKHRAIEEVASQDEEEQSNEAYERLNSLREAVGMLPLGYNERLSKGAKNHACYLVANGEASHYQQRGESYFSGIKPSDRAVEVGYASRRVSENFSSKIESAKGSIEGLFAAIYHRLGFLDTSIDEIGIGVISKPNQSAFVYVMGNSLLSDLCSGESFEGVGEYFYETCSDASHRISKEDFQSSITQIEAQNPPIIRYPYPDQEEVAPAFYVETPDPLPDYEVSGFPISVSFNPHYFDAIKMIDFALYDAMDQRVELVRLLDHQSDPHQKLSSLEFALFPLERLSYGALYRVEFLYNYRGVQERLVWYFHTKSTPHRLYTVEEGLREIELLVDTPAITLYFKPRHGLDLLGGVSFSESLGLQRIDPHTVEVTLPQKRGRYEIQSEGFKVELRVI
jgi:uncharacterized protein YkwD